MFYESKVFRHVSIGCSLCFCLIFFLNISVPAQTGNPVQLGADAQKIKDKIVKIGQSNDITVEKRGGDRVAGSVSSIEADRVVVADVDSNRQVEIRYDEITKVSKGYGNSRDRLGRRIPPKKHLIGLIIGAAAILIPVVIVVASMRKD